MPSAPPPARSAIIAAMRHAHVPTPAILLVVASVFCFTLLDTIMKFATQRYPLPVLIFARYGVQMIAMLVWLGPSMRFDLLRTRRLPLQIVRALILLLSSVFFISALKSLPLAEATALNYSTPMIVVLMARVFLGERLTPLRIAFVIAGAIGMVLIVRPGSTVFQGAAGLALLAAVFYAGYQIMTRLLSGENPRVLLFYPAVIGTLVMGFAAPAFDWPVNMPWDTCGIDHHAVACSGRSGTSCSSSRSSMRRRRRSRRSPTCNSSGRHWRDGLCTGSFPTRSRWPAWSSSQAAALQWRCSTVVARASLRSTR